MTKVTEHAPGTFSWVDLGTTDVEGAKKFYSKLFNWNFADMPAGEQGVYSMAQLDGQEAAAAFQMGEDLLSRGIPPHWTSYVTVVNAEESAAKAQKLGGTLLMEPFDVMDAGRMAVIQGPTGETFSIWEPKAHIGATVVNEPGSLNWNELATTDHEKAGAFYTKLFGWSSQLQEMPMTIYTIFMNGERMNGGMLQMTEEWGDIPSHWMVYFAVEDCDASAEKAKELGGEITVPPTDIPPAGRFSVIKDPQGAVFSIIKLNNPA